MIDTALSQFAKELRELHGWSHEALAETANVSLRTIQRIERGKPMSVETLAAVSRAFELERRVLLNAATMNALIPTMERLTAFLVDTA